MATVEKGGGDRGGLIGFGGDRDKITHAESTKLQESGTMGEVPCKESANRTQSSSVNEETRERGPLERWNDCNSKEGRRHRKSKSRRGNGKYITRKKKRVKGAKKRRSL